MGYDKDAVKNAVQGRWREVLTVVGGIGESYLDGQHHPCPKCAGNDRFRAVEIEVGALFCNHCFSTKNGDGIAAVQWLLDCDFKTALGKIANHLGIKPAKKNSKKRTTNPAKDLEFKPWSEPLAKLWCLRKKPIQFDAFEKFGARMAMYQETKVVALPIWRGDQANVVGWYIMNVTGGGIPVKEKNGNGEWVNKPESEWPKGKSTYGSKTGAIGFFDESKPVVYKTEGATDALALVSIVGDSASVITNSNGAGQNPAKEFRWLPDLVNGKEIRVIHDADKPGQDGATYVKDRPGWSPWLASNCPDSIVKNLQLPYEVQPTKGKDLRDFITDGNGISELDQLAEATERLVVDESEAKSIADDVWEADDDPDRLAKLNLKKYEISTEGGRLLFYRNDWWKYKTTNGWQKIALPELKAKVTSFIRKEFKRSWLEKKDNETPVRKVTTQLVTNVILAMSSKVCLAGSVEKRCWLEDRSYPNIFAMGNGLLDVDKVLEGGYIEDSFRDHSSNWFDTFRADYDFNINADCPDWLKFLDDIFNGDQEQIRTLQKLFGYYLTYETYLHKILLILGPPRSGKGTILRILSALIGEQNRCAPSLASFAENFGLQDFLGKKVAMVTDARLGRKVDAAVATNRLLAISGEDPVTVDIKHREPVTTQLKTRVVIATNLLPRLIDQSGALSTRLICLDTPNSYLNKEDHSLFGRLYAERPGIFNWSFEGMHLLSVEGISQPKKSAYLVNNFKTITQPISSFISDCCILGKDEKETLALVYKTYIAWLEDQNQKFVTPKNKFSENVMSACPEVRKDRDHDFRNKPITFFGLRIRDSTRD